jgi:hypothetical protein
MMVKEFKYDLGDWLKFKSVDGTILFSEVEQVMFNRYNVYYSTAAGSATEGAVLECRRKGQ